MNKNVYRVPEGIVQTLKETGTLEGYPIDHLIDTAIWAFSQQEAEVKNLLVQPA